MIRVAVAARSSVRRMALENLVRSSAQLELSAVLDWPRLDGGDDFGDVLLVDGGHTQAELLPSVSVPSVLLSEHAEPGFVNAALRVGFRGVIPINSGSEEVEAALRAVRAGLVVTAPLGPMPREDRSETLSDRETEVLALLAEGLSNKLIAARLNISDHTVKTHVAAIMGKLKAGSRTEAVSQAVRRGLVML